MTHHGEGLFRLTKDKVLVDSLKKDYRDADIADKDRVMLDYAVKLTLEHCACEKTDVERLRESGFDDADILDIVQVTAYYNYVNRMACGLGVELEGYWEDDEVT
jgi:uncharacterized peroxidase-related enzyme